jgi:hypothetical protein
LHGLGSGRIDGRYIYHRLDDELGLKHSHVPEAFAVYLIVGGAFCVSGVNFP